LISLSVFAQEVSDDDRRGFDELYPIFIDLDLDGKPDRIQPRTYQTYHRPPGKRLLKRHIKNWITFDITTSGGKPLKSIFTYNYGTAEEALWVYALIVAEDKNKDGRPDLMFYAGDDTGDETVILLNKGNRFPIHSRKVSDTEDWGREAGIGTKP
jgi:hypothetical protein